MQISFTYLNHNGKRSERTIEVDSLEFHRNPGFGYQPGWFISGLDRDKNARRSFALARIELPPESDRANTTVPLLNLRGL